MAQFIITPENALIDELLEIKLTGCVPAQNVIIRAESYDEEMNRFTAFGEFITNAEGSIRLASQKPQTGSYDIIDGMGLFWSMAFDDPKINTFYHKTGASPVKVTLSAEINDNIIAQTLVERRYSANNINEVEISEDGLVGTLYHPVGDDTYPGVIILGGSDGGKLDNAAALLASHGYSAMALAYFGIENLPKSLINIPLEYFEKAIHCLQQQPNTDPDNIGIIGYSRGAELALQLGSIFPAIKAVIAGAPSNVRHAGLDNYMPVQASAWSYQDESLPYMKVKNNFLTSAGFFSKFLTRRPISNLPLFSRMMDDWEQAEAASIPVENINGAVLLISGGDDQLWPSGLYAKMIMARLSETHHPFAYHHLNYSNAGHFMSFPYAFPNMPPEILMTSGPVTMTFGGSQITNNRAAEDSWRKILEFFSTYLQRHC
ncbi:acyl-CoA thioesterase/bile acid-CoA:amino acid N-acyltransferase family protein [Salinicoccus albus]|uniref:acyl-CoA thioesterase/bile acid-CoA:amino acid N-acyltransferase family protein n=1 Tax=Salinicoccus albus TaxID=418756 RepID=UPI000367D833|nr:acyl-CoA thioesterase/bile acid-CoA:amino acid N-acyltransferase family protein [Salinicoccus albus]